MRLAASIAVLFLSAPAWAADQIYLFDVLQQRTYRASWDRLMKDVQPTPDWLNQFNRNFDGASGDMTDVTIDGKPYQLSYVCKPTDCAGRKFEVLFETGGAHAFGALGGRGDAPEFFGSPTPAEQEALAKGLKG